MKPKIELVRCIYWKNCPAPCPHGKEAHIPYGCGVLSICTKNLFCDEIEKNARCEKVEVKT